MCMEEGPLVNRADAEVAAARGGIDDQFLDSLEAGVILFDLSGQHAVHKCTFRQVFRDGSPACEVARNIQRSWKRSIAQRFRDPEAIRRHGDEFAEWSRETPSHDELELMRPARRVLERYSRPVLRPEGPRHRLDRALLPT